MDPFWAKVQMALLLLALGSPNVEKKMTSQLSYWKECSECY